MDSGQPAHRHGSGRFGNRPEPRGKHSETAESLLSPHSPPEKPKRTLWQQSRSPSGGKPCSSSRKPLVRPPESLAFSIVKPPDPCPLSHLFSLQPLTPNGYFAGIFSPFAILDLSIPKRRPPPPGFAGMTTPAAPSEAYRSQNRMLSQCHRFSGSAATKPGISGFVRNKFRQISYLPRTSSRKPLKTKNLTKTTPGGSGG